MIAVPYTRDLSELQSLTDGVRRVRGVREATCWILPR